MNQGCDGYYYILAELDLLEAFRIFFLNASLFYYSVNCSLFKRTCFGWGLGSSSISIL